MENTKEGSKKGVTLQFRNVPADKVGVIRQFVRAIKYQSSPTDAIAYEMIKDNPSTPLAHIQKRLRNEHQLQKTINKLKLIAQECGLPFTE